MAAATDIGLSAADYWAARREKCRRDFLYYVRTVFPDVGHARADEFVVNWHHRVLADYLEQLVTGDMDRLIVSMPPRHGKALAVDTPIATPDRGFVAIGDLEPGDFVFGSDGEPTRVTATSPIWRNRPVYDVEVDRGEETIVADENHEWLVQTCRKRKTWRVRETKTLTDRKRAWKTNRAPALSYSDQGILPIDPYYLGLWLGDGNSRDAGIHSGDKDRGFIRGELESLGIETTDRPNSGKINFGVLGCQSKLRKLDLLQNKHIPDCYLRASQESRFSLLQGLVDSDGYVSRNEGQIEFCSSSERLAKHVFDLVRSLGTRARYFTGRATIDGEDFGEKHRVTFFKDGAARLPRKAEHTRDATRRKEHYFEVNKSGFADTVCIEVDADDHLFLAGKSLIPTHNSEMCSRMLPSWIFGRDPDAKIIGASHSAKYANRKVSKFAKNILRTPTYSKLFPDSQLPPQNVRNDSRYTYTNTVDEWDILDHAGSYLSAGTGQPISGSGADYLIIDDPISEQDAYSQKKRDNNWSWWETEASTRVEGKSKVLLVMTRWHRDDLAGRLLKQAREGDHAKQWEEVRFPALYEGAEDRRDPRTEIDEPLWPWRKSQEELFAKRESSPTSWDALWQQRPTPEGGAIIKEEWCQRRWHEPLPRGTYYQSWDLRNGGDSADSSFAVGQLWFQPANRTGMLWLVDQTRGRWDINETIAEFRRRCDPDRCPRWARARWKYVENKADGRTLIPIVKGDISGVEPVEVSGRDGDSGARLNATAPYWSSGDIWLPDQPWVTSTFLPEITSVPSGAHDDQADAASQVINKVLAPDDDTTQSFATTSSLYGH